MVPLSTQVFDHKPYDYYFPSLSTPHQQIPLVLPLKAFSPILIQVTLRVGAVIVWCGHRNTFLYPEHGNPSKAFRGDVLSLPFLFSTGPHLCLCAKALSMVSKALWKHTAVSLSHFLSFMSVPPSPSRVPGPFLCWTPCIWCPAGLFHKLTHSLVQIMVSVTREVSSGWPMAHTLFFLIIWPHAAFIL